MSTSTKERPPAAADPPARPVGQMPSAPSATSPDTNLAEDAQRGDLAAFGRLYRKYFPHIFDFIARVTRDRATAEDLTGKAFMGAVDLCLGGQSNPFLVQLYAIARELAVGAEVVESGTDSGLDTGSGTASLMWEGAVLLGPRTYAVLDLSSRQGLTDAEVGLAMGIRPDIAEETIARTRERAGHAISIFALVKTRVATCRALRKVVHAHAGDGRGTDFDRIIDVHVAGCRGCRGAWVRIPSPSDVLSSWPAATPPADLQNRIWGRIRRRYLWSGPGSRNRRIGAATAAASLFLGLVVTLAVSMSGGGVADARAGAGSGGEGSRQVLSESARGNDSTTATTLPASITTSLASSPTPPPPTTTPLIPSEPPVMRIITPIDGQRFNSSTDLAFLEMVVVVQDDLDEDFAVSWHEGPRYLGSGYAITVALATGCPESSTHTVTATVTDSSDNRVSESVTVAFNCLSQDG